MVVFVVRQSVLILFHDQMASLHSLYVLFISILNMLLSIFHARFSCNFENQCVTSSQNEWKVELLLRMQTACDGWRWSSPLMRDDAKFCILCSMGSSARRSMTCMPIFS